MKAQPLELPLANTDASLFPKRTQVAVFCRMVSTLSTTKRDSSGVPSGHRRGGQRNKSPPPPTPSNTHTHTQKAPLRSAAVREGGKQKHTCIGCIKIVQLINALEGIGYCKGLISGILIGMSRAAFHALRNTIHFRVIAAPAKKRQTLFFARGHLD